MSDDTVLHIAIAEALQSDWSSKEDLYGNIATKLKITAQVLNIYKYLNIFNSLICQYLKYYFTVLLYSFQEINNYLVQIDMFSCGQIENSQSNVRKSYHKDCVLFNIKFY